jgi:NADH-quinone oxidoreductase subunit L
LSAVPPFNGFWSKDMILAAAYNVGGLAGSLLFFAGTATAAITVAYTLRMVALTFLGKESDFIKGKRLHEAPVVMTIPLVILALASITSGFVQAPFVHLMSQAMQLTDFSPFRIEIIPLFYSLLTLLVGGLPAYLIYVKRIVSPKAVTKWASSRFIYNLLMNGYYFDKFYNFAFIKGTAYISKNVRKIQTGISNVNMLAFLIGFLFLLLLLLQGGAV